MGSDTTIEMTLTLIGAMGAFVPLVQAAAVDVRTRRLPDRLVLRAAVVVLAIAVFRFGDGAPGMAAGAAALALPLLLAHLVDPAGLGFGDVKLAVVLGALVGIIDWRLAPVALGVACMSALGWATVKRVRSLAFGPPLVGGAAVVFLGGAW